MEDFNSDLKSPIQFHNIQSTSYSLRHEGEVSSSRVERSPGAIKNVIHHLARPLGGKVG